MLCCCVLSPHIGLRTVHANRHPSDAAGRLRDRPRVHICDAQTAANDHLRGGQTAHPDVPQFAGSAERRDDRRPTHVGHRLRGDGAQLQHCGRRLKSKTAHLQSRPPWTRAPRPPANDALRPRPKPHVAGLRQRWRWRRRWRHCRRWCGQRWTGVTAVARTRVSSAFGSLAPSCAVAHTLGAHDARARATMSVCV